MEKLKHFVSLLLKQKKKSNFHFPVSFILKVCQNVIIIIIRNGRNKKHALENEIFNLIKKAIFLRVMLLEKNVPG